MQQGPGGSIVGLWHIEPVALYSHAELVSQSDVETGKKTVHSAGFLLNEIKRDMRKPQKLS